jgi:hypothetical protein
VIEGYVTAEEAEKKYGVAIRYKGNAQDLVKLPGDWHIDAARTASLRGAR